MRVGMILVLTLVLVSLGGLACADECNSARYVYNNNGTTTDCRTGLIWLNNTNCLNDFNGVDKSSGVGYLTWYDAMKWVAGLQDTGDTNTGCGLSDGSYAGDWRLPTKTELMAMLESAKKQGLINPSLTNGAGTANWSAGQPFANVQSSGYWSSTTYPGDAYIAWVVSLWNGGSFGYGKTGGSFVWPVRGGQSGSFGSLIIE